VDTKRKKLQNFRRAVQHATFDFVDLMKSGWRAAVYCTSGANHLTADGICIGHKLAQSSIVCRGDLLPQRRVVRVVARWRHSPWGGSHIHWQLGRYAANERAMDAASSCKKVPAQHEETHPGLVHGVVRLLPVVRNVQHHARC
jgi:hypothetical protein